MPSRIGPRGDRVVLLLGTTFLTGGIIFLMVHGFMADAESPAKAAFDPGGNITMDSIENWPSDWSQVSVAGCTGVPKGPFEAGDILSGCSGHITVTYNGEALAEHWA